MKNTRSNEQRSTHVAFSRRVSIRRLAWGEATSPSEEIDSLQDVEGVAPLAIFSLLASTGCVLQPVEHVGLRYILNFSASRERIAIETVTEICGQTAPIGQKPRLRALNHQVYVLVLGVVRPLPSRRDSPSNVMVRTRP